ncbi:MAG TPA: hypothetical protein VNX46_06085 [Candidatus Acidoferrum sp.]|nr:hypothetical protein [Candidatus Acidoferrum sp.]
MLFFHCAKKTTEVASDKITTSGECFRCFCVCPTGRFHALSRRQERLNKFCSHAERGFLGLGEILAKEHAGNGLRLSRNEAQTQKDRFSILSGPRGYSIYENALIPNDIHYCDTDP